MLFNNLSFLVIFGKFSFFIDLDPCYKSHSLFIGIFGCILKLYGFSCTKKYWPDHCYIRLVDYL